jgi:phospholipid/cholesterol/gamma-HCH transport system permease protein
MFRPISELGFRSFHFVRALGAMAVFSSGIARAVVTPPPRFAPFIRELYKVGVLSLIIICVSGLVVGMVLGLQGYHTLVRFGAQHTLGAVVGLSLVRELGPVLAALLVFGRAASATAAAIAALKATEQLDGLRMLSIDPIHLIITPRALAMLIVMPLLTCLFIVCGLFGGYVVGVKLMGGDPGDYISSMRNSVHFNTDVAGGLIKSIVFGGLVGLIATYRGYTSAPTSEGVSAATTSTVVISSVTVLLFDYVITALWGV